MQWMKVSLTSVGPQVIFFCNELVYVSYVLPMSNSHAVSYITIFWPLMQRGKKKKVIFFFSVFFFSVWISMCLSSHYMPLRFQQPVWFKNDLKQHFIWKWCPWYLGCCNLTCFYLHLRGEFSFASLPRDMTGQTYSTKSSSKLFPLS